MLLSRRLVSDPQLLNFLLVGTIHQAFEYTRGLRADGFSVKQRIPDDKVDAPVFMARRDGIRGPGAIIRIEVRNAEWVLAHSWRKHSLFDSVINYTDVDASGLMKPIPQLVQNLIHSSKVNGSLTETMRCLGRVIRDIAPEAADYLETWEEQ
jgi:hypothetical protein